VIGWRAPSSRTPLPPSISAWLSENQAARELQRARQLQRELVEARERIGERAANRTLTLAKLDAAALALAKKTATAERVYLERRMESARASSTAAAAASGGRQELSKKGADEACASLIVEEELVLRDGRRSGLSLGALYAQNTCDTLRALLRRRGLPTSGRKAALIERLSAHANSPEFRKSLGGKVTRQPSAAEMALRASLEAVGFAGGMMGATALSVLDCLSNLEAAGENGRVVVTPAVARRVGLGVEEELALLMGGFPALADHYKSSAWRVAALRELCRRRGVKRAGRKAVLADRLVEALRREAEGGWDSRPS